MQNKGWRRFRRKYQESLRGNFATTAWIAVVVLIPGSWLIAVPFGFTVVLLSFGIAKDSAAVPSIGVTITGFGTLILSGMENAEKWDRWFKAGRHGLAQGLWLMAASLFRNLVWISVTLGVFTGCV